MYIFLVVHIRGVPHRFTCLNINLQFMILFEVVTEVLEYGTYQVSESELKINRMIFFVEEI